MHDIKRSLRVLLSMSFVVVILDQLTKYWALRLLDFYHPVYVNDYMNWNLVLNYGAAFGFLNKQDGWQNYVFVGTTFAVVLFLCVIIYRGYLRGWGVNAAFLIMAGGVSNSIDRIYRGAVLDFIQWHFHQWSWPSFNLADAAITLGAMILIFHNQWGSNRESY